MRLPSVTIYTGGASTGPRGTGGWAYAISGDGGNTEASGTAPDTTQNRMKLQAVIEGLRALKEKSTVEVRSDLEYVVNGLNTSRWRKCDPQRVKHKPVPNSDQWLQLGALCQKHIVTAIWVGSQSGDSINERCDLLASQQAGVPEGLEPWWQRMKAERKSNTPVIAEVANIGGLPPEAVGSTDISFL